ncbi:MAG TPA: hypothetical protein VN764_17515, partial [Polyangiaceae bacterium]|nr:hypothetical protein [Polyangiaceae bacterium]
MGRAWGRGVVARSAILVLCLLGAGPAMSQETSAPAALDERAQALQAAEVARLEAERVVAAELARLGALEVRVRGLREEFKWERAELAAQRGAVLGWQRRVREAKAAGPAAADAMYQALRRTLRASRDELSVTLRAISRDYSRVHSLGREPLGDLPPEISTEQVRQRR